MVLGEKSFESEVSSSLLVLLVCIVLIWTVKYLYGISYTISGPLSTN